MLMLVNNICIIQHNWAIKVFWQWINQGRDLLNTEARVWVYGNLGDGISSWWCLEQIQLYFFLLEFNTGGTSSLLRFSWLPGPYFVKQWSCRETFLPGHRSTSRLLCLEDFHYEDCYYLLLLCAVLSQCVPCGGLQVSSGSYLRILK